MVQLNWTMPGAADSFEIERRASGGGFAAHYTTPNATASAALGATANTAFLYRVRAVKGGTRSGWSNVDLATTVAFGADLIPMQSIMMATDVTQLRAAVNAVRALWNAGLAPAAFTDPTLVGVEAKAVHIVELRTVLDQARAGLGLSAAVYTTSAPAAGEVFAAAHINDIRGGVR